MSEFPLAIGTFAAAFAMTGAAALGLGPATSRADDFSNYDGTECPADQFFNASTESCAPDLVTNDPQGEPQPQDVGANYDGTKCDPGNYYNGSSADCTLEAVTNDPKLADTLENGDTLDSNLPVGEGKVVTEDSPPGGDSTAGGAKGATP